jgi:four helix bundle protein
VRGIGGALRCHRVHLGFMADFKKLLVWQKAHAFALRCHKVAGRIRGTQNAALRNQLTRAAQSIAANIVEGRAQESERDFGRFLGYALASAFEVEHHLITGNDLQEIPKSEFDGLTSQLTEIRKMLHGLRRRVTPPSPADT